MKNESHVKQLTNAMTQVKFGNELEKAQFQKFINLSMASLMKMQQLKHQLTQ